MKPLAIHYVHYVWLVTFSLFCRYHHVKPRVPTVSESPRQRLLQQPQLGLRKQNLSFLLTKHDIAAIAYSYEKSMVPWRNLSAKKGAFP